MGAGDISLISSDTLFNSPAMRWETNMVAPGLREALCLVPESISRTLTDYTKDPEQIFERRREINSVLEQLSGAVKE